MHFINKTIYMYYIINSLLLSTVTANKYPTDIEHRETLNVYQFFSLLAKPGVRTLAITSKAMATITVPTIIHGVYPNFV